METTNEELQSTIEELETIDAELSLRMEELKQVNTFTKSILASLSDGVVVLDPEMIVMAWNARSEDLWGLREEEVIGKHFFNLDIGLPAERIRPLIRDSVKSSDKAVGKMTTEATNRRGKAIRCRGKATPLNGDDGNIIGTIPLTGELPPKSAPAQPG